MIVRSLLAVIITATHQKLLITAQQIAPFQPVETRSVQGQRIIILARLIVRILHVEMNFVTMENHFPAALQIALAEVECVIVQNHSLRVQANVQSVPLVEIMFVNASESFLTCPGDCTITSCGNNVCNSDESFSSCPRDCTIDTCGNGL
jgi:hypothetical protein